uniref:KASH domain-containing protein n=1 Tax=Steinernema glaseri TaxID=37863 RepID=A0A1I8AEX5_9BILA
NLERLIDGLSSEGVDSELDSLTMEESFMRDSVERLRSDRGAAVERAKERVARLHDAIAQCEQFEQQLCNCQSWCNHMHHILNLRISADIHALDVPHEYKEAFVEGSLLEQMGQEFEEYENLLTDLAAFIEQNKSQWSSSDRLQLQLEHATNQLNDLRVKFDQFKQPVLFDDRLERVLRELADLEISIDDLTGIKAENCEYSLLHAKQLQKSVEQAMEAITELESSKDTLLREGILSEALLERVVDRLEQTQNLQQQLQSRAEATVEKLERCNNWLEKLGAENVQVDKILNEIEAGLDVNVKEATSLENEVAQIEDVEKVLLQGMPAIRRVAEFEKLLRENSIKIDETSQSHWKGRVAKIQRQLSKWKEDLKDRSSAGDTSDEEKVIQTMEDMRKELEEVVQSLESVNDLAELEVHLTRQRSLKQRLEDKCRHLTALSDKAREKVSEPVAELLSRWNLLETKCQPMEVSVENPSDAQQTSVITILNLPELITVELGDSFADNVPKMLEAFECASDRVNFDDYPVDDVETWNERVEEVSAWFNDHKTKLDAVLDEGRTLANNGRMELALHEAIDKLDNVVGLSNKVEAELDENKGILKTALERNSAFKRELYTFNEVLDQLEERNLSERAIAQATQRDLIDRQNQIESLELKAHEIHCSLPGSSSQRPNHAINEFNRRLVEIEDRLRQTLAPKPGQPHSDVDRVSISSAGAMDSLAMEVHETEDERSRLEHASSLEVTTSPKVQKRATPTILIETVDTLDQVYLNMDEMEDFFAAEDTMPFEDLQEKLVKIDQFDEELERGSQLVESLQMTMDIVENEHAAQRIATLRDEILSRRDQLLERQATKDHLDAHFAKTEQLIAEIGAQIHRTEGRNRSPDLEELESEQLAVEDLLPRAAVHLNQCETKLQPLAAELSAAEKTRFDEKLEAMTKDFKVVETTIKDRRQKLDERCADQSQLTSHIEMLEFWCEETEADIQTTAHRLNEPVLNELYKKVFDRVRDYPQKVDAYHQIEHVKDRFVKLKSVEPDVIHNIRRTVSELGARVSDLRHALNSKKTTLERATADCTAFWNEFRDIQAWVDEAEKQIKAAKEATIYIPSQTNIEKLRDEAIEKAEVFERIRDTWNEICTEEDIAAEEEQQKMLEKLSATIDSVRQEIDAMISEGSSERKSLSSIEEEPIYSTIGTRSKTPGDEQPYAEYVEEPTVAEPEYGTLTTHDGSTITTATDRVAQLKGLDANRLDAVVQMRHWVFETERDASATVDVSDVNAIRQAANKMQNRVDEMKLRQCDLLKILDESREPLVTERAQMCRHELDRVMTQCQRRKAQLNKMLDTGRNWEAQRNSIEIWLTEGSAVLNSGARASELSEQALKAELERVESWVEQLEGMRAKMTELNKISNELLDEYRKDEGHNLSHHTSKINMQWTKFNDK